MPRVDSNHDSLIQSQMSYLLDDRALWGSIFVTRLILAKHYWPRHESLSPGGMYMGCMKRFELSMPSPQLGVLPLHHKHHVLLAPPKDGDITRLTACNFSATLKLWLSFVLCSSFYVVFYFAQIAQQAIKVNKGTPSRGRTCDSRIKSPVRYR